jgi:hypothetical protein
MLPAPGDTWWLVAVVESERRVAGDVLWRNGHMDRDWRRIVSMTAKFPVAKIRAGRREMGPERYE